MSVDFVVHGVQEDGRTDSEEGQEARLASPRGYIMQDVVFRGTI
jgi:hypothetical protein